MARYLATTLARTVLAKRGLALGFYAEHLVAHLVDGRVMDDGMAPWDIEVDEPSVEDKPFVTIQVKATTGRSFSVSPAYRRVDGQRVLARWSDVYVLARHLGDEYAEGWVSTSSRPHGSISATESRSASTGSSARRPTS